MDDLIERIIDWLKANGTGSLDREMLYVGYFWSLKGDPLHEPFFVFEITEGNVTMAIGSDICGPRKIGKSDLKQTVSKSLEMLYDRHMANRPPQVV